MGRSALLTLVMALAGLASCAPDTQRVAGSDPHASLACVQCHEGGLADFGEAAVPSEACAASGCHKDASVGQVTLASVNFDHQEHVADTTVAVGCAGCHTHSAGGEPLRAGPETCGLCHFKELSGARGAGCRLCHADPSHVGMTSQGVPVPHQGLPWIEGGCLRCHYAVARPVHEVSLARCAACHDDVDAATQQGIGEDLHPGHEGNACSACHEADNHRIEAMSSAVDLQCATCHAEAHGTDEKHGGVDPSTCDACHGTVHQEPQRLLLGILPESDGATPASHFMNGLTCGSCHGSDAGGKGSGTSQACVDCHRREYATVLRWWKQGLDERARLVDRYLAGAQAAVAGRPDSDPAVQAVDDARATLAMVRGGGGEHNLPLAQRMFETALAQGAEAYRRAGRPAPTPPEMGRAPREGLCTYCHYRLQEPGLSAQMDDAFHRAVVGK
jgi:hypothetical protein